MEDFKVLLRSSNIAVATVTTIWNLDETTGRVAGSNSFLITRNNRDNNKLDGGVRIYVRKDILRKLQPELTNPDHEVIWVMGKITDSSRHFSCVITSSVYYPESTKNRRGLVSYIQTTIDALGSRYNSPAFIITGDFNKTKKAWLTSCLSLNQIANIPTHSSDSTLDLNPVGLSDHYTLFFQSQEFCEKSSFHRSLLDQ